MGDISQRYVRVCCPDEVGKDLELEQPGSELEPSHLSMAKAHSHDLRGFNEVISVLPSPHLNGCFGLSQVRRMESVDEWIPLE